MAGEDLASATVRIDPDLSYFKDKLKSGLDQETADVSATVAVKPELDRTELDKALSDADAQAAAKSATVSIKPELDSGAVDDSLAKVDAQTAAHAAELKIKPEVDQSGLDVALAKVDEEVRALARDITVKVKPEIDTTGERQAVDLRAEITGVETALAKVDAELQALGERTVSIKATLDDTDITAGVEAIRAQLDRLNRSITPDVKPQLDRLDVAETRVLLDQLGRPITIQVRPGVDTSAFLRSITEADTGLQSLGQRSLDLKPQLDNTQISTGVSRVEQSLSGIGTPTVAPQFDSAQLSAGVAAANSQLASLGQDVVARVRPEVDQDAETSTSALLDQLGRAISVPVRPEEDQVAADATRAELDRLGSSVEASIKPSLDTAQVAQARGLLDQLGRPIDASVRTSVDRSAVERGLSDLPTPEATPVTPQFDASAITRGAADAEAQLQRLGQDVVARVVPELDQAARDATRAELDALGRPIMASVRTEVDRTGTEDLSIGPQSVALRPQVDAAAQDASRAELSSLDRPLSPSLRPQLDTAAEGQARALLDSLGRPISTGVTPSLDDAATADIRGRLDALGRPVDTPIRPEVDRVAEAEAKTVLDSLGAAKSAPISIDPLNRQLPAPDVAPASVSLQPQVDNAAESTSRSAIDSLGGSVTPSVRPEVDAAAEDAARALLASLGQPISVPVTPDVDQAASDGAKVLLDQLGQPVDPSVTPTLDQARSDETKTLLDSLGQPIRPSVSPMVDTLATSTASALLDGLGQPITPSVVPGLDNTALDAVNARLDALATRTIDVTAKVDGTQATTELTALDTEAKAVGAETPTIKPKVDGTQATTQMSQIEALLQTLAQDIVFKVKPEMDLAAIAETKAQEEDLNKEIEHGNLALEEGKIAGEHAREGLDAASGGASALSGNLKAASDAAGGAASGMSGLVAAALGLGPALVPIAAGLTAVVGGLLPVLSAATLGIGAFGLAAADQFDNITQQFKNVLAVFENLNNSVVAPVINDISNLIIPVFAAIEPAVSGAATAIDNLFTHAQSALTAPFWQGFITFLDQAAGPAITSLSSFVGGLVKGLAGITEAFGPFITDAEQALTRIGAAVASFGQNLGGSSGFASFINYVRQTGPELLNILNNLWNIFKNIVIAAAPLGAIVLDIVGPITSLLSVLTSLNPILNSVVLGLVAGGLAFKAISDPLLSAADAMVKFATGMVTASDASGGLTGIRAAVSALTGSLGDLKAAFQLGGEAATFNDAMAVGATGAEKLAAQLGFVVDALGGVGPALAVVGTATAAAAGGILLIHDANEKNAQAVQDFSGGILGLSSNTLPGLTSALDATRAQMEKMRGDLGLTRDQMNQLIETGGHLDESAGFFNDLPGFLRGPLAPVNDLNVAFNKLNDQFQTLQAQVRTGNDDLGFLQQHFDLSRASAEQLANSIGINLTKSLNVAQIGQFSAALKEQATQAGLTQSALLNMANATNQTITSISTQVEAAQQKTVTAWSSYGDAVTAFSGTLRNSMKPTQDDLEKFFSEQELNAASFVQNVNKAIQMGFDPRLISQAIQAGPAQAGQLLQGLVAAQGTGLQQLISGSLNAMSQLGQQAVEQARVTQLAVSSHSDQMAGQLAAALQIDQALTQTNSKQLLQNMIGTFQGGLYGMQVIANEYGITLPTGLTANTPKVTTAATGQATAANTALNSGKTGATAAGAAQGQAHVDGVKSKAGAAEQAGSDNAGRVNKGSLSGLPGAMLTGVAHGTAHVTGVKSKGGDAEKSGEGVSGQTAGGLGKNTDQSAKAGAAHVTAFGQALSKGDLKSAASQLVAVFAADLAGATGPVEKAGEDLAKQLAQGLTVSTGVNDDVRTTVRGIVDTVTNVIQSNLPQIQSQATRIGTTISTAITDQVGTVRTAATQLVTSFTSSVGDGVTPSTEEGKKLTQAVQTGITSVDLTATGKQVLDNFVTALGNTGPARNAGAAIGNAAADGARSVAGQFNAIGQSFTQGLAAGIGNSAAVAQVQQAAVNTVNAAVTAAKGQQGLKAPSPSQKTRDELGIPFVQGVELGIKTAAPTLAAPATEAVNNAVAASRSALSALSTTPAVAAPQQPRSLPGSSALSTVVTSEASLPQAPGTPGTSVSYTPTYYISGGADPTTVKTFQAMLNEHDTQLLHTIQSLS